MYLAVYYGLAVVVGEEKGARSLMDAAKRLRTRHTVATRWE